MNAILAVAVGLLFLCSFSGWASPPEGTFYTVGYPGRGQRTTFTAHEETKTCVLGIVSYSTDVKLVAAVPIFVPQSPLNHRLYILGENHRTGRTELWLGDDSRNKDVHIPIDEIASLTPYSTSEVVVAKRNGTIFILDHDANGVYRKSIQDFFPQIVPRSDIGEVIRAWASSPTQISVLTDKHFIQFDAQGKTDTLILNPVTMEAPNALKIGNILSIVLTGIGDDQYVWIVHFEPWSGGVRYLSLFDISTGTLLQRHLVPSIWSHRRIEPVYFDSKSKRAFFQVDDDLVSATQNTLDFENPSTQLSHSGIGLNITGFIGRVVVTPPAQGTVWGSTGWVTPSPTNRGGGGFRSIGWGNLPPSAFIPATPTSSVYIPSGRTSTVPTVPTIGISGRMAAVPVVTSPRSPTGGGPGNMAVAAPVTMSPKKQLFGEDRTKAELQAFLSEQFRLALTTDPAFQSPMVKSTAIPAIVLGLPSGDFKRALLGLDDGFLHPKGLEWSSGTINKKGDTEKLSLLSEWVDKLWGD